MYYEACTALADKNYNEFVRMATRYLFAEKDATSMSAIMTTYYLGIVQCYIHKVAEPSLSFAMRCLGNRPTMAEFWCLAGDIFFQHHEYARARHFYESARIIGQRRRQDDSWPMHVAKYDSYPTEMLGRCNEITSKSTTYFRI